MERGGGRPISVQRQNTTDTNYNRNKNNCSRKNSFQYARKERFAQIISSYFSASSEMFSLILYENEYGYALT